MDLWNKLKKPIVCAGLLAASGGMVNASTVISPTDGDVNFLFSTLGSNQLYMFDDNDNNNFAAAADSLLIPLPSIVGIAGPNGSGNFTATSETPDTLVLTDSNQFVLAVFDGATYFGDTGVTSLGANSFTVTFDVHGSVLAVDVQVVSPVPVPAALWLFGSGLLGFTLVGRRRSNNNA